MQQADYRAIEHARWTHGMALERQFGLPRGMLVSHAPNPATMVNRVLAAARLDRETLGHLTRMLTVTVQDWVRRKA